MQVYLIGYNAAFSYESEDGETDVEEIECILANLIDKVGSILKFLPV